MVVVGGERVAADDKSAAAVSQRPFDAEAIAAAAAVDVCVACATTVVDS